VTRQKGYVVGTRLIILMWNM